MGISDRYKTPPTTMPPAPVTPPASPPPPALLDIVLPSGYEFRPATLNPDEVDWVVPQAMPEHINPALPFEAEHPNVTERFNACLFHTSLSPRE